MTSILAGALRFRLLVLAAAAALFAVGVVQLRDAPVDVLPEFTPTYAEVQTEALGLSAEEVEQLITVPLEADLLNGVEGVDTIRSESVPGLSSIVMVFAEGTDVYRARQLVEERLTQAHALPNVSKPPALLAPRSSSSRVLLIGLSSDEVTPIEQSVIARWTVRPRLMGVPGVANVAVWGMRDQQLQVQVDPARLRDRQVTLNQVIRTTGNAQVVSPLTFLEASTPGTGGFIETPQQRLQVRHLLEKIADPAELGQVPVEGTDGALRLADVADIRVDHQPLIGDAIVAGSDGLVLVVEKFPGAGVREVTDGVEAALEALAPGLTGISVDTSIFRPASYIDAALDNLRLVLLVGGLLLLLALVALRLKWRFLVVAVVAVPLSLVVACLVLDAFGQGFNALALAGLAAAVAVVVDEALVAADAVQRRLRRGSDDEPREPLADAVREASARVRRPLVFATGIVLLAVAPVVALSGRPGAFFAPLAWGYAVAVLAAMVVALTVTPALTLLLFSRWERSGSGDDAGSRWPRVGSRYLGWLQSFAGRRRTVLLSGGALAVLGLLVLPFLSTAVLPVFQDRNVLVRLEGQPGVSNPRMTAVTTEVAQQLADLDGVADVGAHVGRAVTGDRVTNVSSSDIWVSIAGDADYDATMSAIEDTVDGVAEVDRDVATYTTQKMRDTGALVSGSNEVQGMHLALLTGLAGGIGVRVYGEDPDVLAEQAELVRQAMSSVDGIVDATVEQPQVQPTVEIEVDLEKAQALGISPGDVRRAEATLVQGIQVGSIFQEQKVFDVIVQGAPSTRGSIEDVRNLLIDRPGGGHFTLGQVADVREAQTAAVIQREAVSRLMDVRADVSGRSVEDVAADLGVELAAMTFPIEYHAEVVTQNASDEIGTGRVVAFALAAAIAAFLLLQAAFGSWRLAALVAGVLPLALVGGLVVVAVTGGELSLGKMLGLLAVFTVAVRGSTLLVTGVQAVEAAELDDRHGEGIVLASPLLRAALERFDPVVTSAVAVAALVLPVAVVGTRPGLEIVAAMAVVLLGGLVTTTFVVLFVLPAAYLHFGGPRGQREARDGAVPHPGTPEGPAETVIDLTEPAAAGVPAGASVREATS